MEHKEFNYNSIDKLKADCESLGLSLPISENLSLLSKKVNVNEFIIPNSLAIHPMEGCDGEIDGRPGELTRRRYKRFAEGGAGLQWFEAVAVDFEGRANPRQLFISEKNLSSFQKLHETIISEAENTNGKESIPLCIMQLTHSGRYSRPAGKPKPIIAIHNPYLDAAQGIASDLPVISDDALERLEEKYEKAAVLAKKAGFNGVDVKACHRYLINELLSGFTREGKYGGDFVGRTRFILNIVDRIRNRVGKDFIITSRMNIYDGIAYPYGWGEDKDEAAKYDLTEPIKLIKILREKGMKMINLTMGNPYYNPHINRPYDKGGYIPPEHPLEGVSRMINGIGEIQKSVQDMVVVGTGYSWLRELSPYIAAGVLEKGLATIVGYGREAFAYPDFAKDILYSGGMKKEKTCICCGKCTEIMRAGSTPGCVIRDTKVYTSIYKECCMK